MFSARVVQLRSVSKLAAGLALALCAHTSSYGQSATAPTSSEAPERIDEVWQKASSKYDGQRAELLKDVENADREGRYRADWESLKNYEAPEWYKDAKFGIFIHWGAYSVPAYGSEWYPRMMYVEGSPEYAMLYGPAHNWLLNPSGTPLNNDFTYLSSAWADDWLARSAELVEKYHPDIVYFDWWIGQAAIRTNLARFAAFYYNSSLKYGDHVGVINYKDYAMQENSGVLDLERGQLGDIRPLYWQTDTSVSNKSWGYIENDTFKSPQFVVDQLIDIVSKNGNLLMNIGPRSDGTIPEQVQQVLLDVGAWLNVNGEAIYGTRPWRTYGEGPTKVTAGSFHDTDVANYKPEDFRFTAKGDALYIIGLAWPASGEAVVRSLATIVGSEPVASVDLLGGHPSLRFEQRGDGLHAHLPAQPPAKYAYVLRLTFPHAGR